jgi:hypothetical protein
MGKMKEYKEYEEFKERGQDSESRSQEGAGHTGNVKLRNTLWRG